MRAWLFVDGNKRWWSCDEYIARAREARRLSTMEVVPASEVREKDELIGRLADALNTFDYDGHGTFLRTFGLVKVDGKWEEIEG